MFKLLKILQSGVLLLCGSWVGLLYGLDYPVKNLKVTSLFGESRGDHFHAGMDFGIRQPVFPITAGEVLFIKDSSDIRDVPSGVGNSVIVEHAGQLRSYYYHLEDGSIPNDLAKVSVQDSIGIVGNTGYSIGAHLHLNIEDTAQGVLLNPLQVLPIISDKIKPRIISFFFKINERLYSIKKRRSRLSYLGPIELYGVAVDYLSREGEKLGRRVGVRELTLTIDGENFRRYDFKNLVKGEGGLVLTNDYTFKDVYGLPFNYKFGTFIPSREEHVFEITARDWQDNVMISSYIVSFRN